MSGASPAQAVVADLAFFYRREARERAALLARRRRHRRPAIADAARGIVDAGLPGRALQPRATRPGSCSRRSPAARSAWSRTWPTGAEPHARADPGPRRRRASRAGRRSPARGAPTRSRASRFDLTSAAPAASSCPRSSTCATPRRLRPRHVHRLRPGARLRRGDPRGVGATSTSRSRAACTPCPTRACRCTRATLPSGAYPARRTLGFVTRGRPRGAARPLPALDRDRRDRPPRHQRATSQYALPSPCRRVVARERVLRSVADMAAPPTEHEILDVNRRYHDVAAESYDAKWGISFGEIGHQQVLGKITKLLGPQPRPVRALARDRRRHGLLQPQPAADRRGRARRPARTSAPACSRRSSTTRASSASTSRPPPATPPSCRSRTRPSTSCSATPSCTTCPTSTAASREFKRVLKPGGTLFFAGEPSRSGDQLAAVPKQAAVKARAAVAARDQGAARAARTTARDEDEHALEAVVDVHAFVPADLAAPRAPAAGFADVQRPRRGAAGELVRLVQPHARGQRRAQGRPAGLDPVRLPRLHPAPARRPRAARAAPAAADLLQPDARGPQARREPPPEHPPSPLDMLRDKRAIVDTGARAGRVRRSSTRSSGRQHGGGRRGRHRGRADRSSG